MKRLTATFLVLPLLLSGCSFSKSSITFISAGRSFETYYDDYYFTMNNKDFHHEIAVASFASVMSGIDGDAIDYPNRGENLANLWKEEGFRNIYLNDAYKVKPTTDSIGFGIASKSIEDFTLVAISIRSGSYDAEWASNFTIGASGNAKGFDMASEIVIEGLESYIKNYSIQGHTKFWISGYSRGGAVANLMAGKLINAINTTNSVFGSVTTKNDIFAYCFEPPAAAAITKEEARSDYYQGIHNIMGFNDLVTMIAPNCWGFVHYGSCHYYSDRLTDIYFNKSEKEKLVSNYHFTSGAHASPDYLVDDWKFYDPGEEAAKEGNLPRASIYPSQGRFARSFINQALSGVVTREMYSMSSCEEGLRNLFATIYGYNPDIPELELKGNAIINAIFSYPFIQTMIMELQQKNYSGFAGDVEFLFYMLFNANEENIDAIRKLYDPIFYLLLFLGPSLVSRADLMLQFFSRDNLLGLINPHYTEVNYSFLLSSDPRLYGSEACKLNDGNYYLLNVKSPTSLLIYESNLNKNIFSFQNGTMLSDTLSAERLCDGSLNVYLPKNGDYTYTTDSTDIDLLNVDEYGHEAPIFHSSLRRVSF